MQTLKSKKNNEKIKQKKYGTIEIDTREKDIVQLFCKQRCSCDVVQIERGKIIQLITLLKKHIDYGK